MADPNNQVEAPAPARALAALNWAADAAHAVGPVPAAPERPTPAEHRAVSVVDLRAALDRLLLGRQPEAGLDGLLETGALDVWLPELATMVGFGDGEWRHKDVWKHTKQVVWQSVPRLAVRWGALLHDIGKPRTRSFGPNGEVHFLGHSEVGASMFRKQVAQRIGIEGELFDQVHFLILNHLRASQFDGSWTDSAVRRFAKEMGDGLTDLLDLSRADITTKRPERRKRGLQMISDLAQRIREVEAEDARVPPLPKGLGNAVMERFGIPPSKKLGDLKHELERRCADGELEGGRESEYYVDWIALHREELGI